MIHRAQRFDVFLLGFAQKGFADGGQLDHQDAVSISYILIQSDDRVKQTASGIKAGNPFMGWGWISLFSYYAAQRHIRLLNTREPRMKREEAV